MVMKAVGMRGADLRPEKTAAPKFDLTVTEPLDRWRRAVLGVETARRKRLAARSATEIGVAQCAVDRARVELARAKRDFEEAFLASIDLVNA